MKFQQSELALYEGNIQISGKIESDNNNNSLLPIEIALQACNDQYCLAPEKIQMNISPF
jgi:hypothetical protein